jgi:hypothetical protein
VKGNVESCQQKVDDAVNIAISASPALRTRAQAPPHRQRSLKARLWRAFLILSSVVLRYLFAAGFYDSAPPSQAARFLVAAEIRTSATSRGRCDPFSVVPLALMGA